MWPWKRLASNRELEERLESLERRFKTLLADVDEYFQMVRRAENRIRHGEAKRAKLEEQQESNAAEEPALEPMPGNGVGSLSSHQKAIQQLILKRRAGLA